TMDLYSQYAEGDERKAVTLRTEYVSLKDGSIHESSIPLFGKYFEDGAKIPTESTINLHILRYSDALLMYAEALNETGKTADAYAYLNRVVERAFNDANHNYSGLTQEGFRQAVWQERRLELAFEGHRWFDLVRTGRFIQRMKEHSAYEASVAESNKTEIAQNVKDYMILYPVPQREIDLNHNLTQNPGY
ncbi:MAG: RagB/SusD family nutrient uptake outer membrane protein, partial [Mangrovibacterium sp.]